MKWEKCIWGLLIGFTVLTSTGCELQKKIEIVTKTITTPFLKEVELELPLIKGKLPTEDSVPGQWVENGNHFALVINDNTPVYTGSNATTPPIRLLSRSDRVSVLATYTPKTPKNAPTWAFIKSELTDTLLGWTLKSSLYFKDNLKKISRWDETNFAFCKGNYCAKFTVYPNGSFINHWMASGEGIHMKGIEKGHLLEREGIIYAKTGPGSIYNHILVRTENGLRLENKYQDLRLLQSE